MQLNKLSTFNFQLSTCRASRGFTLIESLIYIILFSVIVGGGIATSFYLIQSTEETKRQMLAEAEANFVLSKIGWALADVNSLDVLNDFEVEGENQILFNGEELLSGHHDVALEFTTLSNPEGVEIELIIGDRVFHRINYIR